DIIVYWLDRTPEPRQHQFVDVVLHVVPDPLQVVLEVLELVLDRVNNPVKQVLNRILEPRNHGINDRSLNVVPDDLHAQLEELELVLQLVYNAPEGQPSGFLEPISSSFDSLFDGIPNSKDATVVLLLTCSSHRVPSSL